MALFYVNGAGSFVPLAIQLYQNPGPANPIWTPHDKDADWLCAKLYLKCADAQVSVRGRLDRHTDRQTHRQTDTHTETDR